MIDKNLDEMKRGSLGSIMEGERDFAERLVRHLIKQQIIHSDCKEMSPEEILKCAEDELSRFAKSDEKLMFIRIDYTDDLLNRARVEFEKRHFDFSVLFYAIYFEHRINYILHFMGSSKGWPNSTIDKILRRFDFFDKIGLVFDLLDLPLFCQEMLQRIKRIMELRNSFVHYKWAEFDIDSERFSEHEKILDGVDNIVNYMESYIDDVCLSPEKRAAIKMIDDFL